MSRRAGGAACKRFHPPVSTCAVSMLRESCASAAAARWRKSPAGNRPTMRRSAPLSSAPRAASPTAAPRRADRAADPAPDPPQGPTSPSPMEKAAAAHGTTAALMLTGGKEPPARLISSWSRYRLPRRLPRGRSFRQQRRPVLRGLSGLPRLPPGPGRGAALRMIDDLVTSAPSSLFGVPR